MSANSSLSQLKKKYRTRYYRNRGQDISELEPGENVMSFVNNYLNITASHRDSEDNEQWIVSRRSGHLRIPQSGEKKAQGSTSKSHVKDTPQHSQGVGYSFKKSSTPAVPKKNEKQSEISNAELFSDEESDNEGTFVVAKLIEESLAENDDIVDINLVNKSEKPTENLYSSDTSVVQKPPSPTSNILAKKWLSFKDSTCAANHNVFTNVVSRTSEEFTNNAQQLKQQEAINTNCADTAYDLHAEPSNNGLVIKDERSDILHAWISSSKKKKASPVPARPKKDKPTTTPKKAMEAPSSVKKRSENVKESLVSSVTAKRPNEEFVIEDESSRNLNAWISPFKKKKSSPLRAGLKEDTPTPTPKKIETPSALLKASENVKASPISSVTAERAVIPEKTNDVNVRKTSFSDIFFRTAKAGHIGNRLSSSSVVCKGPAIPTTVSNEEEFEIEDLTDTNELNFFTIPVKVKSSQAGHVSKREKSGPQLLKTAKDGNDSESKMIKAALPPVVEGLEQHVASSQGVERKESIHQGDILLIESQEEDGSQPTEHTSLNHIEQVQQPQQISPITKGDWSVEKIFGGLDETFTIKVRKGKVNVNAITAAKKTKSKQPGKNWGKNTVEEKKTKKSVPGKKTQKSNKQGKSSKAGNKSESAKDLISNDLEPKEILETSTTKPASGKRTHNGKVITAEVGKNVKAAVCREPHNESLETDNYETPQTVTDVDLQSKKKKAKMKNISTPCPADIGDSVFQSGPVTRHRAVPFSEPMKQLACDLDFADAAIESGGEEEQFSSEADKFNFSSEKQEFFKRFLIVCDPDTGSDALVECIAQGDRSKFVGSDYCTRWNSFSNTIFTTGKLIIAPRKKSERQTFMSKIVIYYVEHGRVQVNLHKSERILKNGDFFFIPPGNSCTITNLQDKDAVLVYNFLNSPLFTEA